jgi:hypothetical protein
MDHSMHRQVPLAQCAECRRYAYEPTWYAALVAFDLVMASKEQVVRAA